MDVRILDNLKCEMINYFGNDIKRINHALKVHSYAMRIHSTEKGDWLTITAAAILHDIGIHAAQEKYNSTAGIYQEREGPPIARRILSKLGIDEARINHICAIIANHHTARDIDTLEFRILWDADWLINIPDELDLSDKDKLKRFIERTFKTDTGMRIARQLYL